jgi:phenylacetate-CoA ligase
MGRADDRMKIKGVLAFPSQIEEAIIGVEGTTENYQILKYKRKEMTEIKVRVEPTVELYKKGKKEMDSLKKEIEGEIHAILNVRVPVEIVKPGSLPRSEGKAKRVVEVE